jgi:hypothetical protein
MTFNRCFLPSFSSLAEGFQRRRLKCEKLTSSYSHFNILFSKPCQSQYELLPSLGVRRLSSVYFSHFNFSLKLGRKHLWKDLSKECTFCYDPLPNMGATDNSCFWLADFRKFSPLKPLGQMNRNLVGRSIYEDCSYWLWQGLLKRILKCE